MKNEISLPKYDIIKSYRHALLVPGGSYLYGTNNENSDFDLRGIYIDSTENLLGIHPNFEKTFSKIDSDVDISLCSVSNIMSLLCKCNPNSLEIVACDDDVVLYQNEIGKMLRDNYQLFLSNEVINSFGGYAYQQIVRLKNALSRNSSEETFNVHLLNRLDYYIETLRTHFKEFNKSDMKFRYDDKGEVLITLSLNDYPISNFKQIMANLLQLIANAKKLNNRNKKKDDNHLNKHAMHLFRLYDMGYEVLTTGKLNVNRTRCDDYQFLLNLRAGKYSFDEIDDFCDERRKKFMYASQYSVLPEKLDISKINEFSFEIKKKIIEFNKNN